MIESEKHAPHGPYSLCVARSAPHVSKETAHCAETQFDRCDFRTASADVRRQSGRDPCDFRTFYNSWLASKHDWSRWMTGVSAMVRSITERQVGETLPPRIDASDTNCVR